MLIFLLSMIFRKLICKRKQNQMISIITFEGSNQPTSSLNLGSSWTLVYSGLSGLATDSGRFACGQPQLFPSNTV